MDFRWAVERYDQVVDHFGHRARLRLQQQARREQRHTDAFGTEHAAERGEVAVHLRLAAREDHPADAKGADGFQMRLEVLRADLADLANPPDVAHQAAAVAAIVRKQHQDGQRADKVRIRLDERG